MRVITISAAGIAAMTLTACGGTSSSGPDLVEISASEAALQIFATGTGDVGDALNADETLSARRVAVSSIMLNYDDDTSEKLSSANAQVLRNADGELSMIIDGERIDFTVADRKVEPGGEIYGYEIRSDDGYFNLFSWRGEITDVPVSGNGYATPMEYYVDPADVSTATTGFFVIGTETSPSGLPTTGSAAFAGYSNIYLVPAEGGTNFSISRQRLEGDVVMEVDFANTTISGTISDLLYRAGDGNPKEPTPGSITMEETAINANGYSGNLRMNQAGLDAFEISDSGVGQYSGAFYGPGAEETGGAITSTIETDEGTLNGYGFFRASKLDD